MHEDVGVLSAEALRRRFRQRWVVDGVSLRIAPGEIVGLLGPNGAGKTTTFQMIAGGIAAHGGRILLDGADITGLPMHERARRGVAYLPQETSVFRGLSAEANVAAVLEHHGLPRRRAKDRAREILERFELSGVARTRAGRLSGGEQRRLEVARALALSPRFVLLDEPLSGVDPIVVDTIRDLLLGLRGEGIGILLSDHYVREALTLTDRAYVLVEGRVLVQGTARELLEHRGVRKHFLGEHFRWDELAAELRPSGDGDGRDAGRADRHEEPAAEARPSNEGHAVLESPAFGA